MPTLKQVAQVLNWQIPRDMHVNLFTDVISVRTGLCSKGSRLVLKVSYDHKHSKWRVWTPYGYNAEFNWLSDALDKARTLSNKQRALELA